MKTGFVEVHRVYVTRPKDAARKMLVAIGDIRRVEEASHNKHPGVKGKLLVVSEKYQTDEFIYTLESYDQIWEQLPEDS